MIRKQYIIYNQFFRGKTGERFDFFSEFKEQLRNGINYTMTDIVSRDTEKKYLLVVDFDINILLIIIPLYRVIHRACSQTLYFPILINSIKLQFS